MTTINENVLRNFILKNVGDRLTQQEAQRLNIENEYAELSEELDVNTIDIEDILDNTDLYEQFATLYVEEKERKQEAKDKEQEKEEQTRVQDKNETGV